MIKNESHDGRRHRISHERLREVGITKFNGSENKGMEADFAIL